MGVPLLWDVIWELGIAPRALMGFLVGTFYTIVCRSPVVPALAQQMQPAPELSLCSLSRYEMSSGRLRSTEMPRFAPWA